MALSSSDKLEYWKKVRDTIQKFDDILTKLSFQGLTLLAAALSLTGALFGQDLTLASFLISIGIAIVAFVLALHTWLYFRLLEKAVETAMLLEDNLFPNAPIEMKLSYNMRKVPGKRSFPVLLSVHLILMGIAFLLAIFYASQLIPYGDCAGIP